MKSATASRAGRTVGRVKRIWSELDYAQRRLFEIRTGVRVSRADERHQNRG